MGEKLRQINSLVVQKIHFFFTLLSSDLRLVFDTNANFLHFGHFR